MKRESTCVSVEASIFLNSCLKQGELIGLSRDSMLDAMKMLLIQNSSPESELLTPTFTYDKTKDGWKLVENVTDPTEIDIKKFEMVSFLKSGESYINGEEMVRRAKEMKRTLGQQHAEHLLANQDQIPKEFRKALPGVPGNGVAVPARLPLRAVPRLVRRPVVPELLQA